MKACFRSRLVPALFVLCLHSTCWGWGEGFAPPTLQSPVWPRWSHEHWVWENEGTEQSAFQLVEDYRAHDIPVSALVIDRPWDVAPNTFKPDPKLYPNLKALVDRLHERDVKVMLWSTSFVNEEAPDFAEAKSRGYLIGGGRTVRWWGGRGALLDYKNPEALEWWHRRMDGVLDAGIDGWKLDGSDPYVVLAGSTSESTFGQIGAMVAALFNSRSGSRARWDEYRKLYYTDYWRYSREKTGKKIAITARPVDGMDGLQQQYSFAPYEVSFSGWVGDQTGDWDGLRAAVRNMKESARRGYLSFGSDIAGFKGKSHWREKELFVRWTQMSAFHSVFENGGGGEHRPWLYGAEVEKAYRRYAAIHQSLVPYIYSSAAWAYENRASVYQNQDVEIFTPGDRGPTEDWVYLLGPSLLVSTVDGPDREKIIRLPEGEWIDYFDTRRVLRQGERAVQSRSLTSLDRYPVWIRRGAILPLSRPVAGTPFYDAEATAPLKIVIFPKRGEGSFPIYDEQNAGGMVHYEAGTSSGDRIRLSLRGLRGPVDVRIEDPFGEIAVDGDSPAIGGVKVLNRSEHSILLHFSGESSGAWSREIDIPWK